MSSCRSSQSVGFNSSEDRSSSGINGGGIAGSTITLAPIFVSKSISGRLWILPRLKSGKCKVTDWFISFEISSAT